MHWRWRSCWARSRPLLAQRFRVRDEFGELYRQAGLLVAPSIAYMYTFSEIAAELALETPGVDALETAALCRGPRGGAGVSVGSTSSIWAATEAVMGAAKLVPSTCW